MFRPRFLLTAVVAVVAALAAPTTSQAAFSFHITIDDGTNPVITQTQSANLFGAYSGDYILSYGGDASILLHLELSANSPGSVTMGQVSSVGVSTTATGHVTAKDIVVTVIADGFTQPLPPASLNTKIGTSNLMGTQQVGGKNVEGYSILGGTVGTAAKVTGSDVSISGTSTNQPNSQSDVYPLTYPNPFVLGNQMTIHIAGGTYTSPTGLSNTNITSTLVAPAPPGLVMLAGALPFAGLLRLRRRAQTTAPATAA